MRVVRLAGIAAVIAVTAAAGPGSADPSLGVRPGQAGPQDMAAGQSQATGQNQGVVIENQGEQQPGRREIATATAGDFRVVVTAVKRDDGSGMPPATVEVEGFRGRDGSWQPIGTVPLDRTAFWHTVTGLDGLCEFSVADTPEPEAEVAIRFTPSAGCAPVDRFHIESGRLVGG